MVLKNHELLRVGVLVQPIPISVSKEKLKREGKVTKLVPLMFTKLEEKPMPRGKN